MIWITIGQILIVFGITAMSCGIQYELDKKLHAPSEGLQFVNIKMHGQTAELNGELIKDPIYRLVAPGKEPKDIFLKENGGK